jgi:pimeloyl-ACP methyl ester carboxylesterase
MRELLHEGRYPYSPKDGRFRGKLGEEALRSLDITRGRETHFIQGPGGRQLAIELSGDEYGHSVVLSNGSPGSRTGPKLRSSLLSRMGVNLITYDRPGYGYSDPNPGRRPIDSVGDVQAILSYLGISEGFSVVGRSGGGPHALACASNLRGVKNAAVLVSVGPREFMGNDWYEGMGPRNMDEFGAIEQGRENLTAKTRQMQKDPSVHLDDISVDFSEDDKRVVSGNIKTEILMAYRKSVEFGPEGWLEDDFGNYVWGFDPREIDVPTLVWYGGQDKFTPRSHGKWLAEHIPFAQEAYEPEAGHFKRP